MKQKFFILFLFQFNVACQVTYLAKSSYNHLKILSSQVPLEEALKNDQISESEKEKIKLTIKVREFIDQDLGLNLGKNYSTFAKLDKPYPVYALQAAEVWELKPYLWWFPIVGSVPYKGYPTEEIANEEAHVLSSKYDVYVRPVPAYSTLGWLKDPLLSSMLKYKNHDLVNTLIHESVHATIYIKDDADFNERLATFLGNKGTELFYQKLEGPESKTLELIRKENEDDKIFSEFITQQLKFLAQWYEEQKKMGIQDLKLRDQRLHEIQENFVKELQPKMKSASYSQFLNKHLNNAILLSYKTYLFDFSSLEKQFEESRGDFKTFINRWKNE